MDPRSDRYARHHRLPDVGEAGQAKLATARVLMVGAGGLGSPALLYLAAAGIGTIGIIDPDRVALTNLQRQILYETGDINRPKVDAARDRLEELNPDVTIHSHAEALTAERLEALIDDYDLIIDGTDNFEARYIINDGCCKHAKPWIMAALGQWEGYLSLFASHLGSNHACYRCFHPTPPPEGTIATCAQQGVLGPLPGMLGSMQAAEALKWFLFGPEQCLINQLWRFHAKTCQSTITRLFKDPSCRH